MPITSTVRMKGRIMMGRGRVGGDGVGENDHIEISVMDRVLAGRDEYWSGVEYDWTRDRHTI